MMMITTVDIQPSENVFGIEDMVSYALQHEFVLGARAFEYNDTFVLAILATPFCLKSERDNAKLQLTESLKSLLGDKNFIITFDMQVYRNVQNELDEQKKAYLLNLAKQR